MKGAFIMAVKFNLRLCLQLIDRGISLNTISKQYHISKHTSSKTKHRMEVLQFDISTIDQYSDDELGKLFFPEMYESENIYLAVDYDYVHKELSKPGVNLKLLWKEYCLSAKDGKYPVSYSKYCRGYAQHVERHNYTNHIEHNLGFVQKLIGPGLQCITWFLLLVNWLKFICLSQLYHFLNILMWNLPRI